MRPLALALALVLAACAAAPGRPRGLRPPRVVRVALAPTWCAADARRVRAALAAVGMPGVRVVEGPRAALHVHPGKDLRCGPEYAPECRARATYTPAAWPWLPGVIRLDPGQLPTPALWRAALAHELAHALGAGHVCRRPGEARTCSPVGYSGDVDQILNPSLENDPPVHWGALDLAELRRVRALPEGY